MKLSELLKGVEYEILQGDIDIDIDDVAYDSRNVKENALFVCVSGYATDGHGFISPAHEKGAKAIIVEKDLAGCHLAMEKAAADGLSAKEVLAAGVAAAIMSAALWR